MIKKFSTRNLLKIVFLFLFGFSTRYLINEIFSINVFVDYTHWISIIYYFFLAFFTFIINELFVGFTYTVPSFNVNVQDVIASIKHLGSSLHNDKKMTLGGDIENENMMKPYLKADNEPSSSFFPNNHGPRNRSSSFDFDYEDYERTFNAKMELESKAFTNDMKLEFQDLLHNSLNRVLQERAAVGITSKYVTLNDLGHNFRQLSYNGDNNRFNYMTREEQLMYRVIRLQPDWFVSTRRPGSTPVLQFITTIRAHKF